MNLSFAGCGFLGIYHVGVAVCFKKYAPHLLLHKISGASAGALAACCLLCDLPLGMYINSFYLFFNYFFYQEILNFYFFVRSNFITVIMANLIISRYCTFPFNGPNIHTITNNTTKKK